MAFKLIEDIKVNGAVGRIFNKYIYSCDVNLGFSENPTTIVINAIEPNDPDSLSSGFPRADSPEDIDNVKDTNGILGLKRDYIIEIGSIRFDEMSLFSYEDNYEVGKDLTTYTFIDKSFILDKIYVGLLDRHRPGGGRVLTDVAFKVTCEVCLAGGEAGQPLTGGFFNIYDFKGKAIFKKGNEINISANGGYIILGTEEFVLNACDIPDISYNFSDFRIALGRPEVKNQIDIDLSTFVDKNPNYRQNYSGTLREVLSAWCSDFGYTFYFDPIEKKLKCIDLTSPITSANIKNIKDILIENRNKDITIGDEPPYILSYSEKNSLENTYDQNYISLYKKPSRAKTTSSDYFKRIKFYPAKIEDLIFKNVSDTLDDYGRNIQKVKTSIGISKYFRNLRWAYHYLIDNLSACGQEILRPSFLTESQFQQVVYEIIVGFLGDEVFGSVINYWGEDNVIYYITYYDSEKENSIIDWETQVGNSFIGKNYYRSKNSRDARAAEEGGFPVEWSSCNQFISASVQVDTEPGTQDINDGVYPYVNLSKINNTISIFSPPARAKFFERSDATWDVDEEAVEQFLDSEDVARFTPEYIPYDDKLCDIFAYAPQILYREAQGATFADLLTNFFESLRGKKIQLMAVPTRSALDAFLKFSPLTNEENLKEVIYGSESSGESENDDCKNICESNPMENFCPSCSYGNNVRPSAGLADNKADSFKINVFNKEFKIIFPSESPFLGYYIVNKNLKYTTQKTLKILGNIIENLNQDTMSINVTQSDITNDVDPYYDPGGNEIVSGPYWTELGVLDVSPESYHELIRKNLSYSVNVPNQIINCQLIGLNFGKLTNQLTPSKGLTNIRVASNENGIIVNLEFSTRPKTIPKQEVLFRNSFIKNNVLNSIKFNTYR